MNKRGIESDREREREMERKWNRERGEWPKSVVC